MPTDLTTAYHEALARQQQHSHTIAELQTAGVKLPLTAWLPTSQRLERETREAFDAALTAQQQGLAHLSRPAA